MKLILIKKKNCESPPVTGAISPLHHKDYLKHNPQHRKRFQLYPQQSLTAGQPQQMTVSDGLPSHT